MNLTPVNVIAFGVGVLLIYCAFKNENPKDVVLAAFGKAQPSSGDASSAPNTSKPKAKTDPNQGTSGMAPMSFKSSGPVLSV